VAALAFTAVFVVLGLAFDFAFAFVALVFVASAFVLVAVAVDFVWDLAMFESSALLRSGETVFCDV
jgi:hypothetical protein